MMILPKGQKGLHRWGIARSSWGNDFVYGPWLRYHLIRKCYDHFDLKP